MDSWIGHPHFTVIDNYSTLSFKHKIEQALDTVLKFIGLPTPTSFYKKYLLVKDSPIDLPKDIKFETFNAIEIFLQLSGDQVDNFLRRSGKDDTYIYTHEIRYIKNNERIVKKSQITPREFISLQESQS